jgi:hypothetical protein
MHGGRIGQHDLIELSHIIHNFAAVEAYHDFPLLQVHSHDLQVRQRQTTGEMESQELRQDNDPWAIIV